MEWGVQGLSRMDRCLPQPQDGPRVLPPAPSTCLRGRGVHGLSGPTLWYHQGLGCLRSSVSSLPCPTPGLSQPRWGSSWVAELWKLGLEWKAPAVGNGEGGPRTRLRPWLGSDLRLHSPPAAATVPGSVESRAVPTPGTRASGSCQWRLLTPGSSWCSALGGGRWRLEEEAPRGGTTWGSRIRVLMQPETGCVRITFVKRSLCGGRRASGLSRLVHNLPAP